jgi:hypothetical protein
MKSPTEYQPMKNVIAIATFLMLFGPVYGREKHSVRKLGTLKTAVNSLQKVSETGDSDTDDQDMDDTETDTDDQTTDSDTETDGTDTDDNDTTGMNKNDDENETDDMDDSSTVKTAIRSALKLSALQHCEKPFAAAAAALNAGLNAPRTIAELIQPADSGHAAVASAAILAAASGGSAAIGGGALNASDNAAIAASGSSSGGKLSVSIVPEPMSGFLLAVGTLPWLALRRRD